MAKARDNEMKRDEAKNAETKSVENLNRSLGEADSAMQDLMGVIEKLPESAEAGKPPAVGCPRCKGEKVPASGGTRRSTRCVVRYRRCADCGHVFATRQDAKGGREWVTG